MNQSDLHVGGTKTRFDEGTVAVTPRLSLRRFTLDDAPFALRLLNEPSFLYFIGDKGVRTIDDARAYIETGPIASYERHGFGLCVVVRQSDGELLGMCGLLRKEHLEDVDIGFAFLPEHQGQGYATEAAAVMLALGHERLRLERIIAVTSVDNERSGLLLEKIGLRYERIILNIATGEKTKLYSSMRRR